MYIKFVGPSENSLIGDVTHVVEAKEYIVRNYLDGTKTVAVINNFNGENHYPLSEREGEYTSAFVMNDEGKTIERISISVPLTS